MKIKDLIAKLEKLSPETDIATYDSSYGFNYEPEITSRAGRGPDGRRLVTTLE